MRRSGRPNLAAGRVSPVNRAPEVIAMPEPAPPRIAWMLNKVPEVTVAFWVIKIMSTKAVLPHFAWIVTEVDR